MKQIQHHYAIKKTVQHRYATPATSVGVTCKNVAPTKKIEIFKCLNKQENPATTVAPTYYEQGIIYPNGTCKIGLDLWRDLDKHDCSSYEAKFYRSFEVVKQQYIIIPINGEYTKGAMLC